ncbi:MAG: recombinase family protein [Actinomycetota bacterium]|nr:recombinase family protein [Actinomycetota bacterium]
MLAGRTLAAIARDLNDQGLTTSTGKAWTYQRLRDVLIRPRNAGLMSTGRPDRPDYRQGRAEFEIVGKAQWPAIVDEETWRAVHRLLIDPSRRKQDGNATRWLGAGIYTCGKCSGQLRAAPHGGTKSRPHQRRFLYRCTESAHLTISCDRTDEYLGGVVAEMVCDPRVVAAMHPHIDADLAADRARRGVLAARLESFETDYALGSIIGPQLAKATAVVTAELAEVDARLTEGIRRSTASPILGAPDPGAAFLAAPVDVQRAVFRSLLRIEVMPVPYRGATWTSERLRLSPVARREARRWPLSGSSVRSSLQDPSNRQDGEGQDRDALKDLHPRRRFLAPDEVIGRAQGEHGHQ